MMDLNNSLFLPSLMVQIIILRLVQCVVSFGGKMKLKFVDGTLNLITDTFDPLYHSWNR